MTHRITQYKVPGKLFESPVWDDQRDCLWCVDIKGGKLHALNLEGLVASYDFQGEPSAIFLTSQPENLLVAAGSDIYVFNIDSGERKLWLHIPEEPAHNRFNDGRVIDGNTLVLGSMDNNEELFSGSLYQINTAKNYHVLLDRVGISNGCTPIVDTLLATDSKAGWLREFRNDENGRLQFTGRQADTVMLGGCPDGHYVDDHAICWIALWGGGKVVGLQLDSWEIMAEIIFPQANITSCTSAVVNKQRVLWVTSAADENNQASIYSVNFPDGGMPVTPRSPNISVDRFYLG